MQVIEKVKVVPEGYNGAGMDGMYGRRDVNGKANAGLTLGIIGTALGAWALFGNRRSAGVLGTGTGLMGDGSTNINVVGVGAAIRPYQDKLIQCEIERAFTAGINYVDKKTCNVIYGVTCLPNEPTTTGLVGRNANGCLPCGFTQPASTPSA